MFVIWASSFMAKLAGPGNQEKRKLLQPETRFILGNISEHTLFCG